MGDIVAERLQESFSNLMNYDFTANMEESLDEVASGKKDWKSLLDEFYSDFSRQLEEAQSIDGGMRKNDPTDTSIICPKPDCNNRHINQNSFNRCFPGMFWLRVTSQRTMQEHHKPDAGR